jgi:hypothetical protein
VSDFPSISQKIIDSDKNIRGVTFGRFDGALLYTTRRPDVEPFAPPGETGRLDAEVLLPALNDYFETHKKYFGDMSYMVVKFQKVSIIYIQHRNMFVIVSVQPDIDVYPIVKSVKKVLENSNGQFKSF